MYKVELTYFRPSGKYYSEGHFETTETDLYNIWNTVEILSESKTLPGLTLDHSEYIVLVEVPDHPYNHPHLVLPKSMK